MRTILVTGPRGQDASYLIKFLLDKGYNVIGLDRRSGNGEQYNWRHRELGIDSKFKIEYCDITEFHNVCDIIKKYKPDELYNLAAQSFVQTSFDQPFLTTQVNAIGQLNILEAVRYYSPKTKIVFSSTSETFGKVQEIPQRETTPFYPRSPYGISKLTGFWYTKNYREAYNIFACSSICFNHEGILRGEEFITRKITKGLAEWFYGLREKIQIGNMDAKRDWGNAKHYIEGMFLMLQQETPDDFVLATGETHSIRELIQICFEYLKLPITFIGEGENERIVSDGKTVIEVCKDYYRPAEVDLLVGDATKAKNVLGWEPKQTFKELIEEMLQADLDRVKRSMVNFNE